MNARISPDGVSVVTWIAPPELRREIVQSGREIRKLMVYWGANDSVASEKVTRCVFILAGSMNICRTVDFNHLRGNIPAGGEDDSESKTTASQWDKPNEI